MKSEDFLNVDKKELAGNAMNIMAFIFSILSIAVFLLTTFVSVLCITKVNDSVLHVNLGLLRFKMGNNWLIAGTFFIQLIFGLIALSVSLFSKVNKSLDNIGKAGIIISGITILLSFVTMALRIIINI